MRCCGALVLPQATWGVMDVAAGGWSVAACVSMLSWAVSLGTCDAAASQLPLSLFVGDGRAVNSAHSRLWSLKTAVACFGSGARGLAASSRRYLQLRKVRFSVLSVLFFLWPPLIQDLPVVWLW